MVAGEWSCELGTIPAGGMVVVTVTSSCRRGRTADHRIGHRQPTRLGYNEQRAHLVATIVPAGDGVNLRIAKTDSLVSLSTGGWSTYSTCHERRRDGRDRRRVINPVPAGLILAATPSRDCAIAAGQCSTSGRSIRGRSARLRWRRRRRARPGHQHRFCDIRRSRSHAVRQPGRTKVAADDNMATAGCSVATFSGPVSFPGSPGPTAVVQLVDMDHDGDLDAVATHEGGSDGVDVFLNDGTGQFAAPKFTSTITGPWLHVVADFNGDTHPDVISASDREPRQSVTFRLLTNDGTGTLTLVPTFSIPFGGSLDAVDIDRDGDRTWCSRQRRETCHCCATSVRAFPAPVTILAAPLGRLLPAFGDFNGDGRTDMVLPLGTPGYAVVLADTSGGFLPPVVHAVAGGANGVTSADLNGDGASIC